MRFCFLLLGGFLTITGSSFLMAQAPTPSIPHIAGRDYNETIADFFDLVKAAKYKAAADYILNTNPSEVDNVAMHEALFTSLDRNTVSCGEFKRFSPIVSKLMGNDIAYVYGVGIYEKRPIRFEFIFFRGDANWQLFSYSYNLEMTDELRTIAGVSIAPPKPTDK